MSVYLAAFEREMFDTHTSIYQFHKHVYNVNSRKYTMIICNPVVHQYTAAPIECPITKTPPIIIDQW